MTTIVITGMRVILMPARKGMNMVVSVIGCVRATLQVLYAYD